MKKVIILLIFATTIFSLAATQYKIPLQLASRYVFDKNINQAFLAPPVSFQIFKNNVYVLRIDGLLLKYKDSKNYIFLKKFPKFPIDFFITSNSTIYVLYNDKILYSKLKPNSKIKSKSLNIEPASFASYKKLSIQDYSFFLYSLKGKKILDLLKIAKQKEKDILRVKLLPSSSIFNYIWIVAGNGDAPKYSAIFKFNSVTNKIANKVATVRSFPGFDTTRFLFIDENNNLWIANIVGNYYIVYKEKTLK